MKYSFWAAWSLLVLLLSGCNATPSTEMTSSIHVSSSIPGTGFPSQVPAETKKPSLSPTPAVNSSTQLTEGLITRSPAALTGPSPLVYETPDWFEDAILYEIFVRSFRDSDDDGIGDLRGVQQQLDYLQELGVNTIWLMPVFPSPSDHGYDITDYFSINPDYGDTGDLQNLVEAAHERQIKVILDFVPSHVSSQHPFFQDAFGNPRSKYSDWFVWTNEAHTTYATFGGNEGMPRLNHYNPEVNEYLTRAGLFWMDLDGDGDYSDGIDGFRIDNATFPPPEFFTGFRHEVKAAQPDFLLLGEAWVNNASDLSRYFPDMFDALFDFPLYESQLGSENTNADGILAEKGFPILLSRLFEEEQQLFPEEALLVRFLGNHDTNRLTNELAGNPERLRLAPALLAALPGPVMIYYGEEIGMPGEKGGPPAWDNYRREPMDWYADESGQGQTTWFMPEDRWNQAGDGISVEEESAADDTLLNTYRRMMDIRLSFQALNDGDFSLLKFDSSDGRPWVFMRSEGEETVVAAYNFSAESAEVIIDEFPFSALEVRELISNQVLPESVRGEPYSVVIPGNTAVMLTSE